MTPNDPAWVGAWWIGFLLGGICFFLIAVPLSGFPMELPCKYLLLNMIK